MEKDAEAYRHKAEEAEQKAKAVEDVEARRLYWRLADVFRELAGLAKRTPKRGS